MASAIMFIYVLDILVALLAIWIARVASRN